MSFMFEVLYQAPASFPREAAIADLIARFGGRVSYREEPASNTNGAVTLSCEFAEYETAQQAASVLRSRGEHVEGPMDYGNGSSVMEETKPADG